jgi:hypothetical protein
VCAFHAAAEAAAAAPPTKKKKVSEIGLAKATVETLAELERKLVAAASWTRVGGSAFKLCVLVLLLSALWYTYCQAHGCRTRLRFGCLESLCNFK